jgi:hypothetical protein
MGSVQAHRLARIRLDDEAMTEPALLGTVELQPLDSSGLRSWEATEIWETFRGKVNRISIGLPRWQLGPPDPGQSHARAWMAVDLTLLPDVDCRFTSAELALRLEAAQEAGHAVIADLEPRELSDRAVVVRESSGGLTASLGATVTPVLDARVDRSVRRRHEVERMLVRLASFGAGTPVAGWRLALTDARDIPLDTTGLGAVIVHPPRWRGTIAFSVVAQLQVRSRLDRWLTAAFGMSDKARLECTQAFPPSRG